jgi:hypothetical protein
MEKQSGKTPIANADDLQRLEKLTDLTLRAIEVLRNAAPDGRVIWISSHHTENPDGTCTVAFRHRYGGKTATFKVRTVTDAKLCCKIMRKETRQ